MHFNKILIVGAYNWIIYLKDHIQSGHIFETKQKYGNKREKHHGKAQDSASRRVYSYNSFCHDTNKPPSRSSHGLFVGSHQPINTKCTPPPHHATTLDNCSISSDKFSIDFCDKKQHLDWLIVSINHTWYLCIIFIVKSYTRFCDLFDKFVHKNKHIKLHSGRLTC